ncbi:MAG: ferredoxin [Solirubrobacterales bacterium]
MKVVADLSRCQGYANCVAAAPEVYDLADNGLVVVLAEEPRPDQHGAARQGASLCPVQALTIVEDDK